MIVATTDTSAASQYKHGSIKDFETDSRRLT